MDEKIMVIAGNFIPLLATITVFRQQDKLHGTNRAMIFLFIMSAVLYCAPNESFFTDPVKSPVISHNLWNDLLMKYVSPAGLVNYKGMKTDEAKLNSYLDQLTKNSPSGEWTKNEEMAYWINAYNAFTVDLILKNYPLKSIRDLKDGKPWDEPFITIGGKKYSLNNIENDFLRKKFSDPRIHFAINCASKSCPKLMNAAFTADKLEVQLNALTKTFINDPSRNKITADKIEISEIFNWYKEDFTKSGTVIDFLNAYSATRISPDTQINYLNYDWSLNESL